MALDRITNICLLASLLFILFILVLPSLVIDTKVRNDDEPTKSLNKLFEIEEPRILISPQPKPPDKDDLDSILKSTSPYLTELYNSFIPKTIHKRHIALENNYDDYDSYYMEEPQQRLDSSIPAYEDCPCSSTAQAILANNIVIGLLDSMIPLEIGVIYAQVKKPTDTVRADVVRKLLNFLIQNLLPKHKVQIEKKLASMPRVSPEINTDDQIQQFPEDIEESSEQPLDHGLKAEEITPTDKLGKGKKPKADKYSDSKDDKKQPDEKEKTDHLEDDQSTDQNSEEFGNDDNDELPKEDARKQSDEDKSTDSPENENQFPDQDSKKPDDEERHFDEPAPFKDDSDLLSSYTEENRPIEYIDDDENDTTRRGKLRKTCKHPEPRPEEDYPGLMEDAPEYDDYSESYLEYQPESDWPMGDYPKLDAPYEYGLLADGPERPNKQTTFPFDYNDMDDIFNGKRPFGPYDYGRHGNSPRQHKKCKSPKHGKPHKPRKHRKSMRPEEDYPELMKDPKYDSSYDYGAEDDTDMPYEYGLLSDSPKRPDKQKEDWMTQGMMTHSDLDDTTKKRPKIFNKQDVNSILPNDDNLYSEYQPESVSSKTDYLEPGYPSYDSEPEDYDGAHYGDGMPSDDASHPVDDNGAKYKPNYEDDNDYPELPSSDGSDSEDKAGNMESTLLDNYHNQDTEYQPDHPDSPGNYDGPENYYAAPSGDGLPLDNGRHPDDTNYENGDTNYDDKDDYDPELPDAPDSEDEAGNMESTLPDDHYNQDTEYQPDHPDSPGNYDRPENYYDAPSGDELPLDDGRHPVDTNYSDGPDDLRPKPFPISPTAIQGFLQQISNALKDINAPSILHMIPNPILSLILSDPDSLLMDFLRDVAQVPKHILDDAQKRPGDILGSLLSNLSKKPVPLEAYEEQEYDDKLKLIDAVESINERGMSYVDNYNNLPSPIDDDQYIYDESSLGQFHSDDSENYELSDIKKGQSGFKYDLTHEGVGTTIDMDDDSGLTETMKAQNASKYNIADENIKSTVNVDDDSDVFETESEQIEPYDKELGDYGVSHTKKEQNGLKYDVTYKDNGPDDLRPKPLPISPTAIQGFLQEISNALKDTNTPNILHMIPNPILSLILSDPNSLLMDFLRDVVQVPKRILDDAEKRPDGVLDSLLSKLSQKRVPLEVYEEEEYDDEPKLVNAVGSVNEKKMSYLDNYNNLPSPIDDDQYIYDENILDQFQSDDYEDYELSDIKKGQSGLNYGLTYEGVGGTIDMDDDSELTESMKAQSASKYNIAHENIESNINVYDDSELLETERGQIEPYIEELGDYEVSQTKKGQNILKYDVTYKDKGGAIAMHDDSELTETEKAQSGSKYNFIDTGGIQGKPNHKETGTTYGEPEDDYELSKTKKKQSELKYDLAYEELIENAYSDMKYRKPEEDYELSETKKGQSGLKDDLMYEDKGTMFGLNDESKLSELENVYSDMIHDIPYRAANGKYTEFPEDEIYNNYGDSISDIDSELEPLRAKKTSNSFEMMYEDLLETIRKSKSKSPYDLTEIDSGYNSVRGDDVYLDTDTQSSKTKHAHGGTQFEIMYEDAVQTKKQYQKESKLRGESDADWRYEDDNEYGDWIPKYSYKDGNNLDIEAEISKTRQGSSSLEMLYEDELQLKTITMNRKVGGGISFEEPNGDRQTKWKSKKFRDGSKSTAESYDDLEDVSYESGLPKRSKANLEVMHADALEVKRQNLSPRKKHNEQKEYTDNYTRNKNMLKLTYENALTKRRNGIRQSAIREPLGISDKNKQQMILLRNPILHNGIYENKKNVARPTAEPTYLYHTYRSGRRPKDIQYRNKQDTPPLFRNGELLHAGDRLPEQNEEDDLYADYKYGENPVPQFNGNDELITPYNQESMSPANQPIEGQEHSKFKRVEDYFPSYIKPSKTFVGETVFPPMSPAKEENDKYENSHIFNESNMNIFE